MKKVSILALLGLGCSLLSVHGSPRPNIIHIMADDLGWRDLSVYGSETFDTPHLDRLAQSGMVFSDAYAASPLCSPTRASTLTGQTVGRLRLTTPRGHLAEIVLDPKEGAVNSPGLPMTEPEVRSRLPLESVTIARILREAGYRTGFMGKWHLGWDEYVPENFGFDHVVGGRGFPGPPMSRYFGPWPEEQANMPQVEGRPNADDVIGDEAVKFISENRENPFFLAFWLFNPHAPFEAKEEVVEGYRDAAASATYQKSAIMASMVKTIDDNVGKIMAELERQGLLGNTIVIFTSDNGGNMYDRPDGVNPTNNYPLKAGKGNNYEGGSRVPLIVSWPGVVESNSYSDAVAISYDFFPTFLEIAALPTPADWPLDGKSLLPAFKGQPFERGPIYSMFGHTVLATGNIANVWIRDGKWKLLRFFHTGRDQQDELELYDLTNDIGETENLALVYPEIAQRLNGQLSAQLEAEATLLPRKNPNYNPDFSQAGFRMGRGGFLIGGPNQNQAVFTAKSSRVTLYFDASAMGGAGDTLAFSIMTNSAISATAGAGKTPVFGPPVSILPDLQAREIRVPLDRMVTGGEITVVFDLEQPGRSHLTNPRLMNAGHSVAIKPRVETGLPSFSFEARPGQPFGDWLPMNDLAAVGVHAGVFRGESAGADPYLIASTVHFHADAVDVISVRMKSDAAGFAELFWTSEGQTGFAPARSLKVSVSGHGQWETLHFPVGMHPQWKGQVFVTHLRIDPINQGGAKFSIESVKASKRDRAGVKTSNSEAQAASRTDRPNFLILLTDDQRFDTIGVNQPGLAIRTPAIDRLAKEGMNFSQGFVTTPICAVSRASILSGRYSRNADIHCFLIPFSKEVFPTTYPAVLKEQGGYFIGQLGKYGVGATAQQQAYFDFFDGDLAQGEAFKDYRGQKLHDSEWLTRRTADFLDAVPEGQPFVLQVNYKAPHPSAAVAAQDEGTLAGVRFDPMPTDTAKDGATVPFKVRRGLGGHSYAGDFGTPERRDRWIGQYLEKIISVDRSVGNIVAMLEARGLDQNTVIVFLSDHGTHFGEKQLTGKWTPYDPSLHIPFIIHDPRATATAGSTDDSLVLNIDVAPTLVDLAGLAVPAEMDGRSIAPLLRGEAPADWRTHFFYEHQTSPATIPRPIPRSMGVRTETAKYVLWSDATPPVEEYYDLSRDPLERFNRLQEQAPAAARLRNLFQQWERDNPDTYTHMPYTHRPQSGAPEIDWDKLKAALPTHFRRIEAEVKRRGVTWDDAFNDPQLRWEIGVAAQYFY